MPRNPLRGLLRRAAFGGQVDSRMRRYTKTGLTLCVLVWILAGAYLFLYPRSYTASFVLVLPGAGVGSSMNLESIGSASSTTAPAFASPDVSPTENYRKMLLSHRLIAAAAALAEEPEAGFPLPKIELTDQTKLITVSITARSPEGAANRAQSLRTAFQVLLDELRQDEIAQRDATSRSFLAGYKDRLQDARQRLIEHQAHSGLASTDQYNTIVAGVERLRDQGRDVAAKLAEGQAQVAAMTRMLGVSPELATHAMLLRGDPLFQSLLEALAKVETELATITGIRGQANPRVQDAQAERASLLARLAQRGGELTGLPRPDIARLRDLSLHDERAHLFERLLGQLADTQALTALQAKLEAQLATEQARVIRLADDASRLENLKRDVQVAEAVFTSALARIDTSKSDYFASYPMVQTLEAPGLPEKPSAPLPLLAIGGGLGATFLIFAALVLSWLRVALLRKILKNA